MDLNGPCKALIEVQVDGKIEAPADPTQLNGKDQWVRFGYINFFTLSGAGTFDGLGEAAWKQNDCGKNKNCKMISMVKEIFIHFSISHLLIVLFDKY